MAVDVAGILMSEQSDAGDPPEWVDLRSAVALTGVRRSDLAWALAQGDVEYSTSRPGHLGVPMLRLADVRALADRGGARDAGQRTAGDTTT